MSNELAREQMVTQQIRAWDVLDETVLDVFRRVPRERFVPAEQRFLAYADAAVPLPEGQHMLPPNVAGRLLQALDLKGPERVLEIGAGSGFLTACLASLAASVRSVEYFPVLAELARANLAAHGTRNAQVAVGDATEADLEGPYDAIAVTASLPLYDARFERLLAPGGRLFVVVGSAPVMEARLLTRGQAGTQIWSSLFETVIDPLINAARPHEFSF